MQHPIQAKVIAGSVGGGVSAAVVTVVLYLVDQVPVVAAWPGTVQGALGVIVTAAVVSAGAWFAGYFAKLTPVPAAAVVVPAHFDPPAPPTV